MLILRNLEKKGDWVYANYFPESSSKNGRVKYNIRTESSEFLELVPEFDRQLNGYAKRAVMLLARIMENNPNGKDFDSEYPVYWY